MKITDKKHIFIHLFASGYFLWKKYYSTACTQAVLTGVAPIVRNRWNIVKLHNKAKIKQYSPIHYNASGCLMSFVVLSLLKLVENYGLIMRYNGSMNICQVEEFFKDKKDTPCPLTERLIKAGYQQTGGGYIDLAKKRGLTADYTKAEPSQYWHLIEEYCPSVDKDKSFNKSIVCGELIFWMAEASKAVPYDKLKELLERIIADGNGATPPKYDRIKWNKEIQNLCFDAIANVVEENIN